MSGKNENNLKTNSLLGNYCGFRKIGAGGMSEVYLAEDTKLDRKVALKILLPDLPKMISDESVCS